jgi:predicted transcriptional regulator
MNMTKDLLLARIAAIVGTLEETNGSPESMLYIFCEMNMSDWQTIRDILMDAGLVTIKSHYVTLTAKGSETAKRINQTVAENRKTS